MKKRLTEQLYKKIEKSDLELSFLKFPKDFAKIDNGFFHRSISAIEFKVIEEKFGSKLKANWAKSVDATGATPAIIEFMITHKQKLADGSVIGANLNARQFGSLVNKLHTDTPNISAATVDATGASAKDILIILKNLSKIENAQLHGLALTPEQFNGLEAPIAKVRSQISICPGSLYELISLKAGAIKIVAPESTSSTVGSTNTVGSVGATLEITGSTASDTLYGGAASDTINGGGGGDSIFGGGDNDLFYFSHQGLLELVTLNGGTGFDTIELTDPGNLDDLSFVNVNLVESLLLSGENTLTLGDAAERAGIRNIIIGTGSTSIDFVTVQIPLLPDAVFTIDAGSGSDLTITGSWGSNSAIEVSAMNGNGQQLDGSAITSNLTVVANENAQQIIGSLYGSNFITGGGGADTIIGGYSSDNFYFRQQDLLSLASLSSAASLTPDGEIQDGTDVLIITEASIAIEDANFANITNMDYMQLTGVSSAVLGSDFMQTGIAVLIAGNGNTQIIAEADIDLSVDAAQIQDGGTLTLSQTSGTGAIYQVNNLQADLFAQGVSRSIDVNTTAGASLNIQSSNGSMSVGGDALSVNIDATPLWQDSLLTLSSVANYSVNRLVGDIDASSSSGSLTISLSDASDNNLQLIAGSGNITLSNGSGSDTIEISGLNSTGQILDGTAAFANLTISAGNGDQVIRGGVALDLITGGNGADQIDLSYGALSLPIDSFPFDPDPNNPNFVYINLDQIRYTDKGQTGLAEPIQGSTDIIDTTVLDIISGLGFLGKINLYENAAVVDNIKVSAGQTILTDMVAGAANLVTGVYDSTNHQFTLATASEVNDDLIFQWSDGVSVQSIVLSGDYYDSGTTIELIGNSIDYSYDVWTTLTLSMTPPILP